MKLIDRLKTDFGQFLFVVSDDNRWSPDENTIFYRDDSPVELLHEIGHALCGHKNFVQDVELLHMERDAWEKARQIAPKYGVDITDKQIESAMDEYRLWLHQRSLCPNCSQNAPQSRSDGRYRCINCDIVWNANDARRSSLRRHKA